MPPYSEMRSHLDLDFTKVKRQEDEQERRKKRIGSEKQILNQRKHFTGLPLETA